MSKLNILKQEVLEANLSLVSNNLVISTWGNASGFDKDLGVFVIKASGVPYSKLKVEHMVAVDLDGKVLDSDYRPSTDTPTHRIIYNNFANDGVCGIVHTHSQYASIWAQLGKSIPCLGTTHADYFNGDIPCTKELSDEDISINYEENTGKSIIEVMNGISPIKMPAVLAIHHAPFTWGLSPKDAVLHSVVLEYIAKMACTQILIDENSMRLRESVLRKHQDRKYGEKSYYGQTTK